MIPDQFLVIIKAIKPCRLNPLILAGHALGIVLIAAITVSANAVADASYYLSKEDIIRVHEKSRLNLHTFYFGKLFSRTLRAFLKQQMQILEKTARWNSLALTDFQKSRQERVQRLIHLFLSTYENMNQVAAGGIEVPHILHRWSASHEYHEMPEVVNWYEHHANRLVFGKVSAEDWEQNPNELIQGAVKKALLKYPLAPRTSEDLSLQLAFILLDIHERFWRGKALRLFGYKISELHQKLGDIPELEYLDSHLAGIFLSDNVIWNQYPETRKHQKALASYFTIIKNHPIPAKKEQPEGDSSRIYLPFGVVLIAISVAYGYFFGRGFQNTKTQDSDKKHDSPPPVTPAMQALDFPPGECMPGTVQFSITTNQLQPQATPLQETYTESITTTRETDSEDEDPYQSTNWFGNENCYDTCGISYGSGSNDFWNSGHPDSNDQQTSIDPWIEAGESDDNLHKAEAYW